VGRRVNQEEDRNGRDGESAGTGADFMLRVVGLCRLCMYLFRVELLVLGLQGSF
jgi:hypothetical protein